MQQEIVNRIATFTQNMDLNESTLSTLRKEFPEVHFTYCSDDDIIDAHPAQTFDNFNLYLVDGNDHCLKFTSNVEAATGVVIAEVYESDDN